MQDVQICRPPLGGSTDLPVQHRKAVFTIIRYFRGLMKNILQICAMFFPEPASAGIFHYIVIMT